MFLSNASNQFFTECLDGVKFDLSDTFSGDSQECSDVFECFGFFAVESVSVCENELLSFVYESESVFDDFVFDPIGFWVMDFAECSLSIEHGDFVGDGSFGGGEAFFGNGSVLGFAFEGSPCLVLCVIADPDDCISSGGFDDEVLDDFPGVGRPGAKV